MIRRRFHIMNAPTLTSIPWSLIEPHQDRAWKNHQQSLDRLDERGGLSACEALCVIEDADLRRLLTSKHGRFNARGEYRTEWCDCIERLAALAMEHVAEVARREAQR